MGSLGFQILFVNVLVVVVIIIVIVLKFVLGGSVSSPQFLRTFLLVNGSDFFTFTSSPYQFGYSYVSIHTVIPWGQRIDL